MSKQDLQTKNETDTSQDNLDTSFSSPSEDLRPRASISSANKPSINQQLKSTRLRYENDVVLNDGIGGTSGMRGLFQRLLSRGGGEFETRKEDIDLEIASEHDGRRKGRKKGRRDSKRRFSPTEQAARLETEVEEELVGRESDSHVTADAARTSVALSPELSHALQHDLQTLQQFARERGDADARGIEDPQKIQDLERRTEEVLARIYSTYADDPNLDERVNAVLNTGYEGQYVESMLGEVQKLSREVGVLSADPNATKKEKEAAERRLQEYINKNSEAIQSIPGLAESIDAVGASAQESASVMYGTAEGLAMKLHTYTTSRFYKKGKSFELLMDESPEMRALIFRAYEAKFGESILENKTFKKRFKKFDLERMQNLVAGDEIKIASDNIYIALKGGAKKDQLRAIFSQYAGPQMEEIITDFEARYLSRIDIYDSYGRYGPAKDFDQLLSAKVRGKDLEDLQVLRTGSEILADVVAFERAIHRKRVGIGAPDTDTAIAILQRRGQSSEFRELIYSRLDEKTKAQITGPHDQRAQAALEYLCKKKLKGEDRKQALCYVVGNELHATVYELLDTDRTLRSHDADKIVTIVERFEDKPGVDNSQRRQEFSEIFLQETGMEFTSWLQKHVKGPKRDICISIMSEGRARDVDLVRAAFSGWGKTNVPLLKEVVQDMTSEQILRLAYQYELEEEGRQLAEGTRLEETAFFKKLFKEVSGHDDFDMQMLIRGVPTENIAQELMYRLERRYEHEMNNAFTKFVGGYFDKDNQARDRNLLDFTPTGALTRLGAGVLNSALGGQSRATMASEFERAQEIFEEMNGEDPAKLAELQQVIERATRSCYAYRGIKQSLGDTVAHAATTGIVVIGGTAFLVATGGTGSVVLVAAGTGATSLAVNAGIKRAFNGDGYGSEGAWKDAGVAAVETASMVGGAHLGRLASQRFGRAILRQQMLKRGRPIDPDRLTRMTTRLDYYSKTHRVQKGVVDGAVDGAFGGATVDGMWTAVDGETWKDGTWEGLSKVGSSAAHGAKYGAIMGAPIGAAMSIKKPKPIVKEFRSHADPSRTGVVGDAAARVDAAASNNDVVEGQTVNSESQVDTPAHQPAEQVDAPAHQPEVHAETPSQDSPGFDPDSFQEEFYQELRTRDDIDPDLVGEVRARVDENPEPFDPDAFIEEVYADQKLKSEMHARTRAEESTLDPEALMQDVLSDPKLRAEVHGDPVLSEPEVTTPVDSPTNSEPKGFDSPEIKAEADIDAEPSLVELTPEQAVNLFGPDHVAQMGGMKVDGDIDLSGTSAKSFEPDPTTETGETFTQNRDVQPETRPESPPTGRRLSESEVRGTDTSAREIPRTPENPDAPRAHLADETPQTSTQPDQQLGHSESFSTDSDVAVATLEKPADISSEDLSIGTQPSTPDQPAPTRSSSTRRPARSSTTEDPRVREVPRAPQSPDSPRASLADESPQFKAQPEPELGQSLQPEPEVAVATLEKPEVADASMTDSDLQNLMRDGEFAVRRDELVEDMMKVGVARPTAHSALDTPLPDATPAGKPDAASRPEGHVTTEPLERTVPRSEPIGDPVHTPKNDPIGDPVQTPQTKKKVTAEPGSTPKGNEQPLTKSKGTSEHASSKAKPESAPEARYKREPGMEPEARIRARAKPKPKVKLEETINDYLDKPKSYDSEFILESTLEQPKLLAVDEIQLWEHWQPELWRKRFKRIEELALIDGELTLIQGFRLIDEHFG